ncbi:TPA: AtpZ/AtpI family protein [Candidatus Poribacteria bacterium]|nr:AtpZ/AtpI family protein [Candidatus Poribacteria bacterium]
MFQERDKNLWRGIGEISAVGLTIVIAIAIGYFGGRYIGGKFGNPDLGIVIGVFLGMASGFMELFRVVIKYIRRM